MSTQSVDSLFYSFAGPLLILGFFYLIFVFFSIFRFKMVFEKSKTHRMIGLSFYFFIGIFSVLRCLSTVALAILAIKEGNSGKTSTLFGVDENRWFVNIFYLPEMVFPPIFFLLYWQLLVLFYTTHMDISHNEDSDDPPPLRGKSIFIMLIIILFSSLFGIVIFILSSLGRLEVSAFFYLNSIFNFATPVIVLITQVYLHVMFSGRPYKSLFQSERKGRVNKTVIFWVFGRTIHGAIDIIAAKYETQVILENFNGDQIDNEAFFLLLFGIFLLVGEKFFIEIVPIVMMFDLAFVRCFFILEENHNELDHILSHDDLNEYINIGPAGNSTAESSNKYNSRLSLKQKPLQINNDPQIPEISIRKRGNSNYNESLGLYINFKNEQFTYKDSEPIKSSYSTGLGEVRLAFGANNELLAIRKITLKSINNYIRDDVTKDFNRYLAIQNTLKREIVNIKGVFLQDANCVNIIFEGFIQCCLRDYLYSFLAAEKHTYSSSKKISILIGIAMAMDKLHSLSEPCYHGHLNPSNIFLINDRVKIGDILFTNLKKYCGITIGYLNKTKYTAPELLSDGVSSFRAALQGPEDVYSFGMIAWELFNEKEPFLNFKTKDWIKMVVEESLRPKIDEKNLDSDLAHIIRLCWQSEREKRPSFSQILVLLKNYQSKCEDEEESSGASFLSFKTGSGN
jgi:hypothetical protein